MSFHWLKSPKQLQITDEGQGNGDVSENEAEKKNEIGRMFQMSSKQAANHGILLVIPLGLIASVSHCLEHCECSTTCNWKVVKRFVVFLSYFRLRS